MLAGQLLFSAPPSESFLHCKKRADAEGHFYIAKRRADAPASAWFHGVTVSTLDFESSDPISNLGGTC